MESHASIGFIFFAIGGLLGQQVVQQHCDENYCYRNDGELKNVTSLKDAQDYCYNNDSASWLLEIYDFQQLKNFFRRNYPKRPFLLNSIGTVANEWKGVTNGQLPSKNNLLKTIFVDYLFFNVILLFHKLFFENRWFNNRWKPWSGFSLLEYFRRTSIFPRCTQKVLGFLHLPCSRWTIILQLSGLRTKLGFNRA